MTNKPLDHETIARAMKEAAWIAKHGTREQRAGWFAPNPERISKQGQKAQRDQK